MTKEMHQESLNKIRVTFREKKLLDLIFSGMLRKDIALHLGCSRNNINQTVSNLCKKYPQLRIRLHKRRYTYVEIPEKFLDKPLFSVKNNSKEDDVSDMVLTEDNYNN